MIERQNVEMTIRSKTGWSHDKIYIGWYVGYLELEDNTIFFATRIEKELDEERKDFSKLRKNITYKIISDM